MLAQGVSAAIGPGTRRRAVGPQPRPVRRAKRPPNKLQTQTSDVHNRIEETSTTSAACGPEQREAGLCLGGWARIATAVDWARRAAKKEKAAGFLFLVGGGLESTRPRGIGHIGAERAGGWPFYLGETPVRNGDGGRRWSNGTHALHPWLARTLAISLMAPCGT